MNLSNVTGALGDVAVNISNSNTPSYISKVFSFLTQNPLVFLAGFVLVVLFFMVVAKSKGDKVETSFQNMIWILGFGIIIIIVVFVVLRMIDAGKFLA